MPTLPPIRDTTALFLDFDGTLAELAPTPGAVRTAIGLTEILGALSTRLDGALAIVSGRPIADLDRFLAPLRPVLAAEHGAVMRLADGSVCRSGAPDLREAVRAARELVTRHQGLLLEEKSTTLALHYRGAPELASLCGATLDSIVARHPELDLLHGKCVVEIKPSGIDKGTAIATLMARQPFAARQPVFAGDDVTDEAAIARVQAMGGLGIKVGSGATSAMHSCASPEALRQWLAEGARQT